MNDNLLQIFLKKNSKPPLVLAPYLPHFQSVLSDLKPNGYTNYGFTKLLCFPEAKIQQSKILCSKSYFTHLQTLKRIIPNTQYFLHSFTELREKINCHVGSSRWRATNVLWASEAEEQCVRIQPPLSSQVLTHWLIYPRACFQYCIKTYIATSSPQTMWGQPISRTWNG